MKTLLTRTEADGGGRTGKHDRTDFASDEEVTAELMKRLNKLAAAE